MSRAFVKEDIDVPERATRRRSASGLPPGAANYITEAGALQLRERLAGLKDEAEISALKEVLDSAVVVKAPVRPEAVVFGVKATLKSDKGEVKICRIVGVDEVALDPHGVSWVSPLAKALLGAKVGQRIMLSAEGNAKWTVTHLD